MIRWAQPKLTFLPMVFGFRQRVSFGVRAAFKETVLFVIANKLYTVPVFENFMKQLYGIFY